AKTDGYWRDPNLRGYSCETTRGKFEPVVSMHSRVMGRDGDAANSYSAGVAFCDEMLGKKK
ncbi:hypothetical protein TeGR_g7673, partial [Tetraparma gracilis]